MPVSLPRCHPTHPSRLPAAFPRPTLTGQPGSVQPAAACSSASSQQLGGFLRPRSRRRYPVSRIASATAVPRRGGHGDGRSSGARREPKRKPTEGDRRRRAGTGGGSSAGLLVQELAFLAVKARLVLGVVAAELELQTAGDRRHRRRNSRPGGRPYYRRGGSHRRGAGEAATVHGGDGCYSSSSSSEAASEGTAAAGHRRTMGGRRGAGAAAVPRPPLSLPEFRERGRTREERGRALVLLLKGSSEPGGGEEAKREPGGRVGGDRGLPSGAEESRRQRQRRDCLFHFPLPELSPECACATVRPSG